jgi:hypothetical protein
MTFSRAGTLHGDHGQISALDHLDREALGLLAHPGQVGFARGRVDHGAIKVRIDASR